MQAIQESNKHLAKATEYLQDNESIDKESWASFEAQFAEIKSIQAVALALLALADALKEGG